MMIYGYNLCRLPPPIATFSTLRPPSPWSARCTLQQTSHPDPDNCSTVFHACHGPQHSVSQRIRSYTTLTCMLRERLREGGPERGAQRLPSLSGIPAPTNKKSCWYVRKRAAHLRAMKSTAAAHDSFARRVSPGPAPLKLLKLGHAHTDSNSRCYFMLEKCG
jgi:hypothetical protein